MPLCSSTSWSVPDVGMVQAAEALSFSLKAFPALGVISEVFGKDFDGNGAIQTSIGGPTHFSHPAPHLSDCGSRKDRVLCLL